MNMEPAEFDPSEELTHFADPGHELFGLSERIYFYLIQTCRAVESFATPAFTVEAVLDPKTKAPAECHVEFVLHQHQFRIDTSIQRVKLWAGEADEAGSDARRWLVFDGEASNPTAWEGLLKQIGRFEHFYVVGEHSDKLRRTWSEWILAQQRLRDERGF